MKKKLLVKYLIIPIAFLLLIIISLLSIGIVITAVAGSQSQVNIANYDGLSEEVESYRTTVSKYAKANGIEDYTNHLLCIMQVSTGGLGTDVMNAGEFESNVKFPKQRGMITEPEYSIECGVIEFKELLDRSGVSDVSDCDKLLVVYQSYHINRGYIDFANGSYSPDNAMKYCQNNNLGNYFNYNFAEQVSFFLNSFSNTGSFIYPLESYHNISSPFGYRHSPTHGNYELHSGTDFPAPKGTPVLASMDGIVQRSGVMGGYGNCVVIKHNATFTTYYGHNSSLAVSPGEQVKQGQVIAYVGSTGNSTGNHCHFEIRKLGKPTDPMPYLKGETSIEE